MVYTLGTLKGRNCIITGGSRGIGFAIAKLFFSKGANCLLISRQAKHLENAANELQADGNNKNEGTVSFLSASVGQASFWKDFGSTEWIAERPPDILVNAAGISQEALFMRASMEHSEAVVQTNLMGTMWACREVAKLMKKKREGPASIINISSILGLQGGRGSAAYAASKAGILGLTRALAAEMGPMDIRVNAIVPGYIMTGMTEGLKTNQKDALLGKIPLGRFGHPSEVAEAASFLALNEYANNCVLNLDGGLSAHL
ncbi:NAD(P)-binding protein [Rhizodiscina lignyota]|uniref:NAD(P)-binding protein n=1 Tax=Rhizodiscina lignyota TaxID=1504668 RepID=A0A9P4M4Z5_9PEZI|nr:NAD(P)-binding protein [Rhizodiscina lignyota]